jgi:gamma-glutamyltranspeptidase / glutathione hydrolase / leukotriene-C4 hydrolase
MILSLSIMPVFSELFVKEDGSLVTEGDLLVNYKLANTFRRIAVDPMTFYTGSLAQDIVDDIKEYGQ